MNKKERAEKLVLVADDLVEYSFGDEDGFAETCYLAALDLDPKCADAMTNLGCLLTEQERFKESLTWHQKALKICPNEAIRHYNLAQAIENLIAGSSPKMKEHLKKALSLDPETYANDDLVFEHLSEQEIEEAMNNQSKKSLKKSKLTQDQQEALDEAFDQAVDESDNGNHERAIELYRDALAIDPNDMDTLQSLGNELYEYGDGDFDTNEAIKLWEKGTALFPKDADFHYSLAMAMNDNGAYAVDEFEKHRNLALQCNPELRFDSEMQQWFDHDDEAMEKVCSKAKSSSSSAVFPALAIGIIGAGLAAASGTKAKASSLQSKRSQ